MTLHRLLVSIGLFLLAGLLEIGGGYLVWLWLRERWSWWVGLLGGLVLVSYGVVPTLQPAHFGRVSPTAASSSSSRYCGAGVSMARHPIAGT